MPRIREAQVDLSTQPEKPADSAWAKARAKTQERQDRERLRYPFANEINVTLPADGPKTIVTIGSPGIGSAKANMEQLHRDLEKIRQVDGVYVLFIGDLISNTKGTKTKKGDLMSQAEQIEVMREKLAQLDAEGKILGAVQFEGNGKMGEEADTAEVNVRLHQGLSYPILDGKGGIINLQFDGSDISYKMICNNTTGPFQSQFNKNHPNLQMLRVVHNPDGIDVAIMVGPVSETIDRYMGFPPNRRQFIGVRAGGYQGTASLNDMAPSVVHQDRTRGGVEPEPSGQAIQFSPQEREMAAFLRLDDAVNAHKASHMVRRIKQLQQTNQEAYAAFQSAKRRRQIKAERAKFAS